MINFLEEKIKLKELDDIIKLHIIIKCFEKDFNLSEADINCLLELKKTGYNSKFFENCVNKEYYRSEQTVRNAVGKMTALGILSYKKRGERIISKEFIPDLQSDKLIAKYMIANL